MKLTIHLLRIRRNNQHQQSAFISINQHLSTLVSINHHQFAFNIKKNKLPKLEDALFEQMFSAADLAHRTDRRFYSTQKL